MWSGLSRQREVNSQLERTQLKKLPLERTEKERENFVVGKYSLRTQSEISISPLSLVSLLRSKLLFFFFSAFIYYSRIKGCQVNNTPRCLYSDSFLD